MRRAVFLLAGSLLFLAALAVAAWLGLSRVAPERLRVGAETLLSDALGLPVSVEAARLELGWLPSVELRGLAAGAAPPALSAPRATAHFDAIGLLLGRRHPRTIRLESPELRLERDPTGALALPFPALRGAGGSSGALPVEVVEIQDGRIRLPGLGSAESPAPVAEGIRGELRRHRFQRLDTLELSVAFRAGDRPAGRLRLTGSRRDGERLEAEARAEALDLRALAPQLPEIPAILAGFGSANGTAHLSGGGPRDLRVEMDLRLGELRLSEATARALRSESLSLRGALEVGKAAFRVRDTRLTGEDFVARLEGSVARPLAEASATRLTLEVTDLPIARLLELALLVPGRPDALADVAARVETGRLVRLVARARAPLGAFAAPGTGRSPLPDLDVEAELADGRIVVSGDERLEDLAGRVRWAEGVLEVTDLRGRLRGDPLPRLRLSLSGLSKMLERPPDSCPPLPAVSGLPGRLRLWDWLRSQQKEGEPRRWQKVIVEADYLLHPALLCPFADIDVAVTPVPEGVRWEIRQAVWGGLPVSGEGELVTAPEETLSLSLALAPPRAVAPVAPAPGGDWVRGHFDAQIEKLGPLRVRGVSGEFHASEGRVQLDAVTAPLNPEGHLLGDLILELGRPDEASYAARVQIAGADLRDLGRGIGLDLEQAPITGGVVAAGVADGRLHAGMSALTESHGFLSVHARDGEIHKRLPAFLAIGMASDTFNPFRSQDRLRYAAIDGEFVLQNGRLLAEVFHIEGPALRVIAAGEVDVASEPKAVEAVLGLFLFRTLDALIARLPLLDSILLGEDRNFVGAYFSLAGPWGRPEARLIPVKSLTSGPASFAVEGFPGFVIGGLKRIQSMLLPAASPPASSPPPEPVGSLEDS